MKSERKTGANKCLLDDLGAWFILDTYDFGMYKELKCSLVNSLDNAEEE